MMDGGLDRLVAASIPVPVGRGDVFIHSSKVHRSRYLTVYLHISFFLAVSTIFIYHHGECTKGTPHLLCRKVQEARRAQGHTVQGR